LLGGFPDIDETAWHRQLSLRGIFGPPDEQCAILRAEEHGGYGRGWVEIEVKAAMAAVKRLARGLPFPRLAATRAEFEMFRRHHLDFRSSIFNWAAIGP